MKQKTEQAQNITNEEYRKMIIAIFTQMDSVDKLRFWYKYISAVETEEEEG